MNRCRSQSRIAACVLVLLSSLGCTKAGEGGAPATPADPGQPATGTAAAATTEGVALAAAMPAMLDKVGQVDLPPAEAPPTWKAGWRLSPGARWQLGYTQHIQAQMGGKAAGDTKQGMEVSGTLLVTATSDAVADVELTDAKSIVTMQMPGQPEQKMEQPLPPKKYPALLTTADAPTQPEDPLVYAILAVPTQPGAVGDVVKKQLSMPVEAPEGTLTAKGTATWTLKGFVKCGEHTCAHYAHDVDINELTLPEGVKGSYAARARAIGWTLFDVDDGALYRHKSATRLHLKADVPAATEAAGAHGAASQPAAPASMDMTQQHLHELTRRDVTGEEPKAQ